MVLSNTKKGGGSFNRNNGVSFNRNGGVSLQRKSGVYFSEISTLSEGFSFINPRCSSSFNNLVTFGFNTSTEMVVIMK